MNSHRHTHTHSHRHSNIQWRNVLIIYFSCNWMPRIKNEKQFVNIRISLLMSGLLACLFNSAKTAVSIVSLNFRWNHLSLSLPLSWLFIFLNEISIFCYYDNADKLFSSNQEAFNDSVSVRIPYVLLSYASSDRLTQASKINNISNACVFDDNKIP